MLDELESDISELRSGDDCYTVIVGDLNARTACLTDCLTIYNNVLDILDFPNEITCELFNKDPTIDYHINHVGHSMDKGTNKYGNRLLSLCKALNMYIMNGRVGEDKDIGKVTCKDASLIDYVISSPQLFECVKSFKVLPFDLMLSDTHNSVGLSLSLNKFVNKQVDFLTHA
jgi:hypothetical protein